MPNFLTLIDYFFLTELLRNRKNYSLFRRIRSHPKGLCSSSNYFLNSEACPSVGGKPTHQPAIPPFPPLALICP
jgi:hypothetical protein